MGLRSRGLANDPKISPKYFASHWKALDLANAAKPNWKEAVAIFHDRIDGRFLEPVRGIQEHGNEAIQEWCGFAVVAIDCLLIETLGQFYRGFDETPKPNGGPVLNPHHWTHRTFYVAYMSSMASLSKASMFDTDEKRELFYVHFRCGILHQAQTKKQSRVVFDEPDMIGFADPADHGRGLIVDRKKLHAALLQEIEEYKQVLLNGTDQGKRNNFIKKMNFIAP